MLSCAHGRPLLIHAFESVVAEQRRGGERKESEREKDSVSEGKRASEREIERMRERLGVCGGGLSVRSLQMTELMLANNACPFETSTPSLPLSLPPPFLPHFCPFSRLFTRPFLRSLKIEGQKSLKIEGQKSQGAQETLAVCLQCSVLN